METGFVLPDLAGEDSAEFWAGCQRGELLVQACDDCGRWRFPPRPMCPDCQSVALHWVPTSGRASVWSFVVAHPPLLPAYAELDGLTLEGAGHDVDNRLVLRFTLVGREAAADAAGTLPACAAALRAGATPAQAGV